MRGLLLLLVLSAATLVPAHLSAVSRQPEVRLIRLQAWLEAGESHTPGRMDAAARTMGAWSNREIHLVTPYVTALIDLLPESPGMLTRELRGSATRAARALAAGPRLSRAERSLILEEIVPKVAAK